MNKHTHLSSLSGTWLVTFGDLLTLLLCLFIAAVSSQQRVNDSTPRQQRESGDKLALATEKSEAGTALASLRWEEGTHSGRQDLLLRFHEHDFREPGAAGASSRVMSMLEDAIISEDYNHERVVIETCARSAEQASASQWHHTLRRTLAVYSQIVDSAAMRTQPAVTLHGPGCVGFKDGVVARVRLAAKR